MAAPLLWWPGSRALIALALILAATQPAAREPRHIVFNAARDAQGRAVGGILETFKYRHPRLRPAAGGAR